MAFFESISGVEDMSEEQEIVLRWPDGTWCWEEDLEEYLTWMSDDFSRTFATEEDLLW